MGELKIRDLVALPFAMMVEGRWPPIGLTRRRGRDARQPGMRPHPQIAVRPLRQRPHDALRGRPCPAKGNHCKMPAVETRQPCAGSEPQESIAGLNYGVHNIRWKPIFNSEG